MKTQNPMADRDAAPALTTRVEDTDAVVSPTLQDSVHLRCAAAFAGLCGGKFAQAYTAVVVLCLSATVMVSAANETAMGTMYSLGVAVGAPLAMIPTCTSFTKVSASQTGHLTLLGAGETKISAKAMARLRRARGGVLFVSIVFEMIGLGWLYNSTQVGSYSLAGRLITPEYATFLFFCGLSTCVSLPLLVFPFVLSLKMAAVLASDAVSELKQLIEKIQPTDPQFEAQVIPAVKKLCSSTMPLVSQGWGAGVGGVFVGCYTFAVGYFALFLENRQPISMGLCVFAILLPMAIAYDVALASSECDELADTLNA
eukprot:SAG25_NODE_3884_length_938_cov_1.071514_1_plen_312_part_11